MRTFIVIVILFVVFGIITGYYYGRSQYNNGQIDALKGKQKYEMFISYGKITDTCFMFKTGTIQILNLSWDSGKSYTDSVYGMTRKDTIITYYVPIDTVYRNRLYKLGL